jgi:ketosteroid isomerase-like protein
MSTQEKPLANTQMLIAEAYSAFNRRDIDGALALMSENVSWPKASEAACQSPPSPSSVAGRLVTAARSLWPAT